MLRSQVQFGVKANDRMLRSLELDVDVSADSLTFNYRVGTFRYSLGSRETLIKAKISKVNCPKVRI